MRDRNERYHLRVTPAEASSDRPLHRGACFCAWVVLSTLAVACKHRDGVSQDQDAATPTEDAAASEVAAERDDVLSLTTFNTGLAIVVRGAAQRLGAVPSALAALRSDALCLQELFAPTTSPDEMAEQLAVAYPYSVVPGAAATPSTSGLLIASRLPLEDASEYVFEQADPTGLTDRLVLGAQLDFQGRSVRVLCTHLVSGLDVAGTAARQAQVRELVRWADDQGYLGGDSVLLGDFNAGPDPIGDCTPSSEPACLEPDLTTYDLLLDAFDDPFADATLCTQCRDVFLPLQILSLFDDEPDQRIDHCLVASASGLAFRTGGVVLDQDPGIAAGSTPLRTLSDHLGVTCSFR